jgi:hypothetical protein
VHEEDFGLQGCGLWRGLARRPITLRIEFVELDAGTDFDSQDFGLRRGLVQRPTTLRNEQCYYYHCSRIFRPGMARLRLAGLRSAARFGAVADNHTY